MGERCSTCGSEDIVTTGPLTIEGRSATLTVIQGKQCTLCGNLQISVPQALLIMLYPPGVRYLTESRRTRLQQRRRIRHRQTGI